MAETGAADAIRVLIVDDHPVYAEGLARLLADFRDLTITGVATTAEAAWSAVCAASPDVLLLDQRLPDYPGIELATRVRSAHPHVAVIMLTGAHDRDLARAAAAAGCASSLGKESGAEDVVDAVRHAASTVANVARPRRKTGPLGLSPRELEVLRSMAKGLTAKEMSEELHLSMNTVRNYSQHVLTKLRARSKAEAVAIATRHGLLHANHG